MRKEEACYWIALSHLEGWKKQNINQLIIKFFNENKISIEEFFGLNKSQWLNTYGLNEEQVKDLSEAKLQLANYAFLAESLYSQGFEIIPITSPDYSKTLKMNLKAKYAPAVLYIKGNKEILKEKSIAIVGSRNASEISLQFTDNIAKLASQQYKVVVSGFAKGVDRQALDSALKYQGQSIIVLPQGILTFSKGFKDYYKQIVEGNVLVLSTFHPNVPWSAQLAMARNPIIYGLAEEIYVAQSSEKGGTWEGVKDGLKKGRKIFVRKPEHGEDCANEQLIQEGAIPVDFYGNELPKNNDTMNRNEGSTLQESENQTLDNQESLSHETESQPLEVTIRNLLNQDPVSAEEILNRLKQLKIDLPIQELTSYLESWVFVEIINKEGENKRYKLKPKQGKLF